MGFFLRANILTDGGIRPATRASEDAAVSMSAAAERLAEDANAAACGRGVNYKLLSTFITESTVPTRRRRRIHLDGRVLVCHAPSLRRCGGQQLACEEKTPL